MVVATLPPDIVSDLEHAKANYDANGVILIRSLLSDEEITRVRHVFTKQVETDPSLNYDDGVPEEDALKQYPRFVHPHRHTEIEAGRLAKDLLLDRRFYDIVEELIGPAYAAQTMFFFKPPSARGQALHQDNWFVQAHPETCVAAWIAVDDTDDENGGLRIIPGTHTEKVICHGRFGDASESFVDWQVPTAPHMQVVKTEMKAGDVLFFHGSLVHGSMPNRSNRFRRSLIFHYIPQESKEVAKFYLPLLTPDGRDVDMSISPIGGPCGNGAIGAPEEGVSPAGL